MFGRKVDIGIRPYHIALTMRWSNTLTPDIARLEQKQWQLLFVCDDWMSDRYNSHILREHGALLGKAFTQMPYRFYNYCGYGQRIPVVLDGLINPRKIMGELYAIRPATFLLLDRLRLNTVQFQRRQTNVIHSWRDQIVFENTTEERKPLWPPSFVGIDRITGKFPEGHPLAGKKYWLSREKTVIIPEVWMYLGRWAHWSYPFRSNIAAFHEVQRFQPKEDKRWLSEYYKFQNKVEGSG